MAEDETPPSPEVSEEAHAHPWPYIQTLFAFQMTRNNSHIMRCLLCQPKTVDISSFKNSTLNLRKHVMRVHPNKLKLYTDCIENSRKQNSSPAPTDEPHLKNAKISAFSMSVPRAFRVYSKSDEEATDEQEENAPDDEGPLEEVEYQDVSAILNDDTGLEYQLPRHHRCACHLLNLVSTTDASAAEVDCETYKRLSRSAFAKCQALWNKTSRSTIAFETVERECRLQFLRPNDTRWSSLYLAVERVVQIHKEKGESAIRNVCTALNIKM
ncbi:hypothetical protein SKAU_G00410050 [Synaphobranchus kaupii]|uniref:BED-type domain-containing protein n=1 Tax=Synaphobranchus kaupii TaxID=118154 RepID=A0A9Q1E7K8_SYNKA|nr:hypothetical protein SKAU_G00410050 [Synaphobranchus kaupii]